MLCVYFSFGKLLLNGEPHSYLISSCSADMFHLFNHTCALGCAKKVLKGNNKKNTSSNSQCPNPFMFIEWMWGEILVCSCILHVATKANL